MPSRSSQDGASWRVVLKGVAPEDPNPMPHFGGVATNIGYHGSTNMHAPLVPTVQSAVSLWGMGARWDISGRATAGPMNGRRLKRVQSEEYLWFAWAAFRPDTRIWK